MEEAALAWFSRCRQGLSAEQETEFQNWLTADPRHAALFNEFDGTWELLGRVGAATPMAVTERPRPHWRRPLFQVGMAAVALVFTYLSWWRPSHYAGEVGTAVGAVRTLPLPDGSVVVINTDSAVAVAFTPQERRVTLRRGEAHFTVARNADRPFIVEARGVAIRAVGTAFKIHLWDKAVEVLVTEGKVRVDDAISGQSLLARPRQGSSETLPALGPPVLASGHKVMVALPAPVVAVESRLAEVVVTKVSHEEAQRALAWRERRLDFELAPLSEIVTEFNRHNRHQLVIGDAALAHKRFGGSFKSDDPEGFVRMLQESFGLIVEESEAATVLRTGP
jgi:transmembrane sensor